MKRIAASVAILTLCLAAPGRAAGKSDVADAVMSDVLLSLATEITPHGRRRIS